MSKPRKRQNGDTSNSITSTLENPEHGGDGRPDPERISARAYELYLARGAADGQAWDDWLAAERELSDALFPQDERDE